MFKSASFETEKLQKTGSGGSVISMKAPPVTAVKSNELTPKLNLASSIQSDVSSPLKLPMKATKLPSIQSATGSNKTQNDYSSSEDEDFSDSDFSSDYENDSHPSIDTQKGSKDTSKEKENSLGVPSKNQS